jgi:ribonuclease Z
LELNFSLEMEVDVSLPQLYVLGSGTALPSAERDNTSLVVETPGGLWLIDCGGSAYQKLLRLGLDPMRLCGVFLSHNHLDHIYGLPALLFHLGLAGWLEDGPTLHIYGNAPTLTLARRVLDAYEIDRWRPPTEWHELPEVEGHPFAEDDHIAWFSTPVTHSRPTLAVKVVAKGIGHTAVYSADTSPCESLVRFAAGADTLLHECTAVEPFEGHSTPLQVGEAAAQSGVRRLVVVHYDPRYILPTDETLMLIRKGGFDGEVLFAKDGMTLPLDK